MSGLVVHNKIKATFGYSGQKCLDENSWLTFIHRDIKESERDVSTKTQI